MLRLIRLVLGEFQENCYLLSDPATNKAVLIDPGAQAGDILAWAANVEVGKILITHGHSDHVGALEEVRGALGVPVGIHPADEALYALYADFALEEGQALPIGDAKLEVVHMPGHTPGSVGFRWVEAGGAGRAIVGDAVFPGGPGHTETPEALSTSLVALARTVFTWDDDTALYPGHGEPTTVGAERRDFEDFRRKPLPPDLCGDVTWR